MGTKLGAPTVIDTDGLGLPPVDYEGLLRVAETLSAELDLDRLLTKLVRIGVETASADRALLVLDEGGLALRAVAEGRGGARLESTPLDGARSTLPVAIIERAHRLGEIVVIDDADRARAFDGDAPRPVKRPRSILAVPLGRSGRRLGVLCFEGEKPHAFHERQIEVFRLLSGEIAVALENSLLFEERRRAEAALQLLSDAGVALAESLDLEQCLANAGRVVLPTLADGCVVDLLEEGQLRTVVVTHVDADKSRALEALLRDYPAKLEGPQPSAQVLRTGRPVLLPHVSDEQIRAWAVDEAHLMRIEELRPLAVIAVPLAARGRPLGVATMVRTATVRHYGPADLSLALELSRRISLAIDNALLHRDLALAMRQRVERDRYLDMIFGQLPGVVWMTDRSLRTTYATGGRSEVPRPKPGAHVGSFLEGHEPAGSIEAHHRGALLGERQSFQCAWRGRWYAVLVEPFRGEGGGITGCVGVAFDVTERREIEERLAISEARLSEAQRVAHIGSFVWDIANNVVTWSEEMHRIYGLDPGHFGGTYEAFLALVPPDEREATKRVILEAMADQKPFTYDHRINRADGQTRMIHTRGDVISDELGAPTPVVGSCWDVTDVKTTIQELELAVARWEATLNATTEGILVVDTEGRVSACNQRFLELWRLSSVGEPGLSHLELLAPMLEQLEDPDAFAARLRELYGRPDEASFDLLRFKDGRVFERHSMPQRVGEQIVGRVWSVRDVSEKERLLRRATFLADATRLLASLDVEPALESVARMAVPYMGESCAIDVLGDGIPRRHLVVFRDAARPIEPAFDGSTLAGEPSIRSVGVRDCMSVPLVVKGAVIGAMSFVAPPSRPYTRQDLELAEELARRAALSLENAHLFHGAQEALRARDEFLSVAAHEIRGPITSMHLAVQGVLQSKLPASATPKMLEIIEREDRRLAGFVDELLEIGRLQGASLRFTFERVDLCQVVREAASRLSPELRRSGSTLTVDCVEDSVVGWWDKARLGQVVVNLLSNAAKFGLGKPIDVTAWSSDGRAMLSVRDRGIGIAREMHGRIFQPFERAVSSRHYGGLGLGLHIARTIVEGLGGSMRVDSQPNVGSTFTVDLPLRSSPR